MKSMRITLLTMAVLLSTSALASHKENYKDDYKNEAMPCPTMLYLTSGFYLGAQAGFDTYRGKIDTNDLFGAPTASTNPVLAVNGPELGIFVGFGQYFPQYYRLNLYLGLEGFANATSAKNTNLEIVTQPIPGVTTEQDTTLRAEYNYGVSLLPGIRISANTLAYIRLGYNAAQFSAPQNELLDGIQVSDVDKHPVLSGFQYGLGFEAAFDRSWSIRVEYTHTGFSDFTNNNGTSFDMSDNQFTLGAIYHIHYWP